MENLYIIHTSGSTGSPKAVAYTHSALFAVGALDTIAYNLTPKSVMIVDRNQGLPFLRRTFDAIASGCNLVSYRGPEKESLRLAILEKKVTHLCCLATTFRWIATGVFIFPEVQLVEIGGEMCNWDDIRLMRERFPNAVHMVRYAVSEVHFVTRGIIPHDRPLEEGRLPVGIPIEGVEINIVDHNGEVIPNFKSEGKIGEIVVKSPYAADGYYNDPQLTAAKFKPLGYFTGDLGYFLPDGWLAHCGRKDFNSEWIPRRTPDDLTVGEKLSRIANKTIGSL